MSSTDPALAYVASIVHDGPTDEYAADIRIENHGIHRVKVDRETHNAILSAWQYALGAREEVYYKPPPPPPLPRSGIRFDHYHDIRMTLVDKGRKFVRMAFRAWPKRPGRKHRNDRPPRELRRSW